jgi:hypothetical protein
MFVVSGTRPTATLPSPVMTHRTRVMLVSRQCGHIRYSAIAPARVRTPVMMNDTFITECMGEQT